MQTKLPLRRNGLPDTAPMTRASVKRIATRSMPRDLRAAGFEACVFRADPVIHGADYWRFSFGKRC